MIIFKLSKNQRHQNEMNKYKILELNNKAIPKETESEETEKDKIKHLINE